MFPILKKLLNLGETAVAKFVGMPAAAAAQGSGSGGQGSANMPPALPTAQGLLQRTSSPQSGVTDKLQSVADVAGVFDQTGAVDLANSAVSLFRGWREQDPQRRKEHYTDSGIRAVSAVPLVGDLAKVGRTGRYMDDAASLAKWWRKWKGSEVRGPAGRTMPATTASGSAPTVVAPAIPPPPLNVGTPRSVAGAAIPPVVMPPQRSAIQKFAWKASETWRSLRGGTLESTRDETGRLAPPKPTFRERFRNWRSGDPQGHLSARERYFYGTKDSRKAMRTDMQSTFFDPQEVVDDEAARNGMATRFTKQRSRERNRRETLHQEFLRDPDMDVTQRNSRVQTAKSEFEEARQEQLTDRAIEQAEEVVDQLKKFKGGLVAALTAIVALPFAVKKFGEALVEARRSIGMYDGGTASRLAQVDVQRFQLDMQSGRNTSASTNVFLDQMAEFREAFQPLRETAIDIANTIGTGVVWLGKIAAWLSEIHPAVMGIRWVMDWFYGKERNQGNKGQHGIGAATLHVMGGEQGKGWRERGGRRPPLPPL